MQKSPLLMLMEKIQEWRDSAASDAFWDPEAEHFTWMESLRGSAKEIIIWLELKKQDDAALRLDGAIAELREAILEYRDQSNYFYPPEDSQCRSLRDKIVEKTSVIEGVCKDLYGEVPREVWEGFEDA